MAAMFEFNGRLHMVAFIFITVLIQRCTEMQRVSPDDVELNNQQHQHSNRRHGCCRGRGHLTATAENDEMVNNTGDMAVMWAGSGEDLTHKAHFHGNAKTMDYRERKYVTGSENNTDLQDLEIMGSSVWCWGADHKSRMCRFKNLCYIPDHDDFVFFHSVHSVLSGVPLSRFDPSLLDLSSVHDHNGQYFNYVDLPAEDARSIIESVHFIDRQMLMFKQFNPENLMHVLHDDLLPLFHTLQLMSNNQSRGVNEPFDVQILFLGNSHNNEFSFLYDLFSIHPSLYKPALQSPGTTTCFKDIYVGISKSTTWYQYGFRQPQGPMPLVRVSAHEIRQFTEYLKTRLHSDVAQVPAHQEYAVLLTRKHNRLILNDLDLSVVLATQLKVKVMAAGMETHSLAQIVSMLSKASVLIGMHGSLLSLAMFLPVGAIMVELFPYAVNPQHYTPYRTLAGLPGMGIIYRSWRNMDPLHSVGHPSRHWDKGGIIHLSQEDQKRIMDSPEVPRHLCCRDPEWLYRIYQDTIVDVQTVVSLIKSALSERHDIWHDISQKHPGSRDLPFHKLHPGKVENIGCNAGDDTWSDVDTVPPSISLSWKPPWNTKYVGSHSIKYEVWIQEHSLEHYTAWIMSRTSYKFTAGLRPHTNYSVWVRCILDDNILGPFNQRHILCST